jgi:hypothetical protein
MTREELALLVAECDDPEVAAALVEDFEQGERQAAERVHQEQVDHIRWLRRVEDACVEDLTSGDPARGATAARLLRRAAEGGADYLPSADAARILGRVLRRVRPSPAYTDEFVDGVRRLGVDLPEPSAPF